MSKGRVELSMFFSICLLCYAELTTSCIVSVGYDFSELYGTIWESHNESVTYTISICQPLSQVNSDNPCHGSAEAAICQLDKKTGVATVIGNHVESPVIEAQPNGVTQLLMSGANCSSGDRYNTLINFKCGKTLGSPIFLDSYACSANFEWYTRAACKTRPTAKEVKCYLYNAQDEKIDLGPLIKTSGGHRVTSFVDELYINVCRDITAESTGETAACNHSIAACYPSGLPQTDAGHVKDPLHLDDKGRPVIKYVTELKGDAVPANCMEGPTTTVTFVCPDRGKSTGPILFSQQNCQNEIQWSTEYACPEDTLKSSTCVLNKDKHGIEANLTSLMGQTYRTIGNNSDGSEQYIYALSICGEIIEGCPDERHKDGSSSCQMKQNNIDVGKSLGKVDQMELRYSDGDLILTYNGGDTCRTNFQRRTIINFHCANSTVKEGPVFTAEDECTYMFDWNTPLACLNSFMDNTCSVEGQGQIYDLSGLVITDNMKQDPWEVLKQDNDTFLIINVCNELPHKGLAALCEEGSAACVMDRPGHWINLGLPSQPTFDSGSGLVQIHYSGGSECSGGGHYQTVITFFCNPDALDSPPILKYKSENGCKYIMEWETAAVCLHLHVVGENCIVTNPQLGLTFDLRPLTSSQGYYKVTNERTKDDYYINVCAPVTGTPCNSHTAGDYAACQRSSSGQVYIIGKVSKQLHLESGFLNLTYADGDAYDSTRRPRVTEIAFFCNPNAGIGKPEFVADNMTYVFRWETSHACADVPVECVAVSEAGDAEYDLTSLIRTKSDSNWVTTDDEQLDGKKRTFYINICHQLSAGIDGCDPASSVCEKTLEGSTEVVSHINLGKSRSPPVIDAPGELTLTLTDGGQCETNSSAKYTTKIHLHCFPGASSTSPRLMSIDQSVCEYIFSWDHEAACSIDHAKSNTGDVCTLTDPNLSFTYNLKPLMARDYNVSHSGDFYQLHICGAVSGSCKPIGEKKPAVCLGDKTLGEVDTQLKSDEPGKLTLEYRGSREALTGLTIKVIIEFICDRTAGPGEPHFIEKDGMKYIFRFPTAYACPPAAIECKAVDPEGRLYDLNYLSKDIGNWEVVDIRPAHGDLRYYINVCKPVNQMPDAAKFCSGLAGGCQTNGQGEPYSLGYLQGAPTAPSYGTVILRYSGGDKCHENTDTENYRSTVIIFNCASTEHDPVFINETMDCEYLFSWETPLACPVAKGTGSFCQVMEPNFIMTFDLSNLNASTPYKVAAGEYEFLLNVCADIPGETGECQGVGSCQTKPSNGEKINAGKSNANLIYEDGELRLVYDNGKPDCHDIYTRQTIITFICDKQAGIGKPVYLNESSTCQYLFMWHTSSACPPAKEVFRQCSVQDGSGKQYDLSELRATRTNYEYIDNERKLKYLINVCSGVIHQKEAACPVDSAVCLVHLGTTISKYESLGSVSSSSLSVDTDVVILRYASTRRCANGNTTTTTIKMICDKNEVASEPLLLDDGEDCEYVFQWTTSRACPINTRPPPGGDCAVTNPQTGIRLSLSTLQGRNWKVTDEHGHSYDISVCGALKDSHCGDNIGSCQYDTTSPDKSWNSGRPNSDLIFNDGTLRLVYKEGAACHGGAYKRSTIIDFVCGTVEKGENEPVFIFEDANCTYFMSWHTNLACETETVTCTADAGDALYDLSPLVLADGYHSAVVAPGVTDNASYYINLCRPLNPIPGTPCPPQAAVCQVYSNGKVKSLGQVTTGPVLDPVTNKVTLLMTNGNICESDSTKKWTTKIIFECQHEISSGSAQLDEYDAEKCEAVFIWPTFLVCKEDTKPDVDKDCTYTDTRRNYKFDFSDLKINIGVTGYKVPAATSGDFYVNICSSVIAPDAICGSAGVCQVKDGKAVSFGDADYMTFVSSDYNIKLVYNHGDTCHDGTSRQSFILLECDYLEMTQGNIKLFNEGSCSTGFIYKTHRACPPVTYPCVYAHSGTTFDLTPLSRVTGSWTIQDADKNFYWFNLCRGVNDGPTGCSVDAAVCWQPSGSDVPHVLARVSTQTTLMKGNDTIVYEYSGGDATCRGGKSGSPKVRIQLACGSGVGKPIFMDNNANEPCLFEISWKTSYACAEKSESVYANSGFIMDPETQLQIYVEGLSNGRTYKVDVSPYRYIVNLNGEPSVDSKDCLNSVVCQTHIDDNSEHESLGEKDTQKFFIKGGILQAQYTSPTPCSPTDNAHKAISIIDFHCSHDNITTGPVFVYKSPSCHYIFDWNTPGVCELEATGHPGTSGSGAEDNSLHLSHKALGVVIGVTVTILVILVIAMILYKPSRRARVTVALRRIFRKQSDFTTYSYSQLSQAEEDSSLLRNSRGQYGSDSNHLGNIQDFLDDSDDDILQL